ncbi:hypothetical protein F5B21DRAFT_525599 [Xylaria acuta]|nr:hypothetical protein F5B21DRAFT_525599 [Xylaria acuta]
MFQWYASAVLCYVYLSDVVHLPNATEDEIKSSLANSRWVSQVWTLQELIAPVHVVFYSGDWQVCGTRSKLSAILAESTLIDEPYLNEPPLDHATCCLLGIFNVNIPLIYEEKSKVFRRFQEAIIREYPEGQPLYARGKDQIWESKPIDYCRSPAERKLFSLFAGSPAGFMESGRIVRAPLSNGYFDHINDLRSAPFSIGHAIQVELPVMPWDDYAAYALLLCGKWRKNLVVGAQVSRTNEIVTARKMIPTVMALNRDTQRYIYKLPRPYPLQHEGILFRRIVCSIADVENKIREGVVDAVRLNWLNPPSSLRGMLHAIAFEIDSVHCFVVFIQRLGSLNSGHADRDSGGKRSRLGFGLARFGIISQPALSPGTRRVENVATSRIANKKNPETSTERKKYFWEYPKQILYSHEMEVPQDEWRLNLAGYANVHIAIGRMYVQDDDDDEDIGDQPSDCFDNMGLVIRVKGDPGYKDPRGSEDNSHEDGENADGGSDNRENEGEESGCGGSEDGVNDDEGKTK